MAVTSRPQRAGSPPESRLEGSSLSKGSWIKISQIRTLSVDRIGDLVERLPPETLSRLVDSLNEMIG